MATIKSYTDLQQSKKLAEILPLKSADMYIDCTNPYYIHTELKHIEHFDSEHYPCWSLAALLDILTEQDYIIKANGNEFNIDIPIRHCKIWFSSLLDAAFEIVVWLKKNEKI